ncbi:hypothetical protein Pr1d_12090 [Bythopirellula goksoeyrii]|uniref:Uncharacterized protein n=1 Tax=Bythopirellula goksoeyrii TaxID=1400387 RepID=A0A5B9Q4J1_9BACT|nr:hypothetical protein Pr1d_12090 [Bythopirellula goksoeyrii]
MRILLQVLSVIALLSVILPSILFLAGQMDLDKTKLFMLIATIVWFVVTPLWMGRVPDSSQQQGGSYE